jgi:hypothetical protein
MSAITTLAPSRANIRAVAVPMPDAAPEMMATLPANLMTVSPFVSLGRLSHQEKAGLSGPSELGTGHRREDNSRLTLAPPDLPIGGFLRWRAVQIKL